MSRTANYEGTARPYRASRDSSQLHADPQHRLNPPATLASTLASSHLLPGRASRTRAARTRQAPVRPRTRTRTRTRTRHPTRTTQPCPHLILPYPTQLYPHQTQLYPYPTQPCPHLTLPYTPAAAAL